MDALNKIGVIGTQCVGKTTLIADIKERWPVFTSPEKTYRDLIKEKNLPVNKAGTKEAQQDILDFLIDEAMTNYGHKKLIFDRTPLDNLVYSLWLYGKETGNIDEAFIDRCVPLVRNALKFYSVIFYIPFCKENDCAVIAAPNREIDPEYRSEIGHLFQKLYEAWEQGSSRFFDKDDCPAIVPVFGSREERIAMISLYINDKGSMYGEDESLIASPFDEQALKEKFSKVK